MTGVGSISMSGALTLTGTAAETAAISFSRASYNYIHAPTNGLICLQPNGIGATSAAGYHFNGTEFFPAADNTYTLGTSSKKWKNVYATTFTGPLSGNASSATYATNIRITSTNPTSATTYNPIWAANSAATSDGTDNYTPRANNGFSYITLEGTASALGFGIVRLGNSTASGTAGNKYGMLRLYSESSGYVNIRPGSASTSNYTLYLPGASGQLVYHTNDTQIGADATPVYVSSGGMISACSIVAGTSASNRCLMVTNGSNGMYYTPSITGNYFNGALISTVSDTTAVEHTCTNSNGSVSLYAATNRGLYDKTNGAWIIYLTKAADHVYVSKWASKGSTTAPVYFNSSGEPIQGSTYAGGTKVTLNGTAKGASTASFYAPTGAGTSGQYLIANSSGIPTWHTIDPYDYNTSRTANTVLAAPDGSNGSATFRKLVAADLPSHSHGALGSSWYTTFTVDGDANTYYPVVLNSVSSKFPMQLVNISRGYSETAPNSWNTSTHRGGLTLTLLWNGSRYWDGNGSGAPCHCVYKYESYCVMVGGIGNSTSGIVVWLRGGGAIYHLHSMNGKSATATVYLDTYTDSASNVFAPTTTVNSFPVGWPYALNSDKVDNNHSSAFATASHTHNYAGSSSPGGPATLAVCSSATSDTNRPILVTNESNGLCYTTKAKLNYSTGRITCGAITITDTTAVEHIKFSRENSYNYVTFPSGSHLAFISNGKSISSTTPELIISTNVVYPGTTNVTSLGTSSLKWSNVYATTFTGKMSTSFTVFGVDYNGSAAKTVTGETLVGTLSEGTSNLTDGTMLLTSYASDNGFADTNAPNKIYKRKASCVWGYIKGKTDAAYAPKSHNHDSAYAPKSHTHSSILDIGNSSTTTFAYSKDGLGYDSYTWLAGWNGYELRAINKSQFAKASHTHSQYYDSGVSRTANTVLAAPNGSAGSATFRKLVAADLPSHTHNYAAASHTHTKSQITDFAHTHNYAGSSSAGGAATSANKLNTNAGSATKPVYFSNGVPVQVTGCMVQYWAIYEVYFASSGTSSSFVKKAGNHNFYSSVRTHEGVGNIIVNISYPTGFDETSTFIFGNGDHRESNHVNPIYLTVNKQHSYLRLTLADDSTNNWGYAYLYFLCIS
jgi:hypothetical protein